MIYQEEMASSESVVKQEDAVEPHNNLKCGFCGKTFVSISNLIEHMKRHGISANKTSHKCFICGKEFSLSRDFERHVAIHSNVRPYQCSSCIKAFRTKTSLTLHEKTHSGERPHLCTVCGKAFVQKPHLQTHMVIHSDDRPFVCANCGCAFKRKADLDVHKKKHQDDTLQFMCTLCSKAFSSNSQLRVHQLEHTGATLHKCPHCLKLFESLLELNVHAEKANCQRKKGKPRQRRTKAVIKKKTPEVKPCHSVFFNKSAMDAPSSMHTNEIEQYTCQICQKEFTNSSKYWYHMLQHKGKTYVCDTCGKSFLTKVNLEVHKRIHNGDRPYHCEVCARAFVQRQQLTSHFRLHTGEKPYVCPVCKRAFAVNGNLTQHVKKLHPEQEWPLPNPLFEYSTLPPGAKSSSPEAPELVETTLEPVEHQIQDTDQATTVTVLEAQQPEGQPSATNKGFKVYTVEKPLKGKAENDLRSVLMMLNSNQTKLTIYCKNLDAAASGDYLLETHSEDGVQEAVSHATPSQGGSADFKDNSGSSDSEDDAHSMIESNETQKNSGPVDSIVVKEEIELPQVMGYSKQREDDEVLEEAVTHGSQGHDIISENFTNAQISEELWNVDVKEEVNAEDLSDSDTTLSALHTYEAAYHCDSTSAHQSFISGKKLKNRGGHTDTCHISQKGFSRKDLNLHIRKHADQQLYQCETCGKCFAYLNALATHMKSHKSEKEFQLAKPSRHHEAKTAKAPNLTESSQAKPQFQRTYMCAVCAQVFHSSWTLRSHEISHTTERPHQCTECGKKYKRNLDLRTHMRVHSGEKPHVCEHCGNRFVQQGHLQAHLKTHTGEKSFVCEVCGRRFALKGNLTAHMKIH